MSGYIIQKFPLEPAIKELVRQQNWDEIDQYFQKLSAPNGSLFEFLRKYQDFSHIEFIISLREAKNEWEEDGIWHDDGSRLLAFSLSLTEKPENIQGGILEIRPKGEVESVKIATAPFGEIIIFQTGTGGYEHKINAVTRGARLIIAGWCS